MLLNTDDTAFNHKVFSIFITNSSLLLHLLLTFASICWLNQLSFDKEQTANDKLLRMQWKNTNTNFFPLYKNSLYSSIYSTLIFALKHFWSICECVNVCI